MSIPSDKDPAIDAMLTELFGVDRKEMIRLNRCVTCGNSAGEFRDPISEKEYTISGMCQNCQDSVFGEDDDYEEEYE